jgi:hypothetical protein
MRILKQAVGVLGTLVVLVAIAALAIPKTAHALVATLVQVVNTSANSVPTSDAGVALEPFEFQAISRTTPVNSTSFTTPSTTADGRAVQRLVIEEVTVQCSGLSSPAAGVRVSGFPFSGAGANLGLFGSEDDRYFPFPNNPASGQQVLAQQTRIYVDPGLTVYMNTFDAFETSGVCAYTASGHFIVQ